MSLSKDMKKNKSYLKVFNTVDNLDKDCEKWMDELMQLQATKPLRVLSTNKLLQSAQYEIVDTNINNYASRARANEIRMRAFRLQATIDSKVDNLKKHLLAAFAEELRANYKSLNERRGYVESICRPMTEIVQNLKNVVKLCDYVIEDNDSASYTMMRINDALTINNKGK